MSSIEKSFEILSKHNRYGFVPGSFALIDTFLQHQQIRNCCLHYNANIKKNLFPDPVKLIGYLASDFIVVLSKPCVGPTPRTKIYFFIIKMYRSAHIINKNNNVFAQATICP